MRDDGFTDFVAGRWGRLVRTAVLLGCTPAEAEDVVQSALIRVLLHWRRVRASDDVDAYVTCPSGRWVALRHSADRRSRRGDSGAHPCMCDGFPPGVTIVYLDSGDQTSSGPSTPVVVDGVQGRRSTADCGPRGPHVCQAWLYLPREDVTVRVESSLGGETAPATATVERLLDTVRVDRGRVAVPDYELAAGPGSPELPAVEDLLRERGFRVESEVAYTLDGYVSGVFVDDLSPRPGTMVEPGSLITVHALAPPELAPATPGGLAAVTP